ncbi:putative cop9 signalosome complex subunit 4 protein [Echria macrotheca]|uniref:COP9 signalosome complex subunit 4 n=1 Tax=Echria macrotheca TaxID=438768 RepID=A0AAJ0BH72_9PEZI|nr:putative cop9 signalosome complex subunit 4 protein [Echria macrotheca]
MPARLDEALAAAAADENPAEAYKRILDDIRSYSSLETLADDLVQIANSIFEGTGTGVVFTRTALSHLIDALKSMVFRGHADLWILVGQNILETINGSSSLSSSLLEQSAALREMIATAHETNEDFLEAAKVLAEIPLDSSQRRVPDAAKAQIWVRIVRNYLEVDDSTAAETFLNKLKNVMHTVDDPELQLHFKLSVARIQDSKRHFLAAAQSYHDISFTSAISEEERLHTLGMAIKCAILAPAGPPRSRVLGRLYKDERSAGLEEYGILEKMFLDRLLAPAEVDKFAQGLAPHQLATTSDGSTVLAKAVVEHNLLGVSRLYNNIGFDALGVLLGLDGDKAEDTTAKMIEQGRLSGSIDQMDRIIYFGNSEASGEKGSGRAEVVVGQEIRRWDGIVEGVAEEVERIADAIQSEFPEFVARQIAV